MRHLVVVLLATWWVVPVGQVRAAESGESGESGTDDEESGTVGGSGDAEPGAEKEDDDSGDEELQDAVEDALEEVLEKEVGEAVQEVLDETLEKEVDEAVKEALEEEKGDGDEGKRTLLGFRARSERRFEVNADLGFVSTLYDRGEVVSDAMHRPALTPALSISFDFGAYATLESTFVLPDREVEKASDEVALTVGYNNHTHWFDFDIGLAAAFTPQTEHFAGTAELYLAVGTGDFLPVVMPSFFQWFTFAGRDGAGEAEPLGWYGQVRVDAHGALGKGHSITAGVAFGMDHFGDQGFRPVEVVVDAYYTFDFPFGLYLAPGLTYAYAIPGRKHVFLGRFNVGISL